MSLFLLLLLPFLAIFRTNLATNSTGTTTVLPISGEEGEEIKMDNEWMCGTDDLSKLIAESTVEKDCPANKNAINNCCVAHDKCYDDQLGQKHCDDIFCNCLDLAATGSAVCEKEDSPYFCQLVRQFGEQYYNASAKVDGKSPIVPESVNGQKHMKIVRPVMRQQRSAIEWSQ